MSEAKPKKLAIIDPRTKNLRFRNPPEADYYTQVLVRGKR